MEGSARLGADVGNCTTLSYIGFSTVPSARMLNRKASLMLIRNLIVTLVSVGIPFSAIVGCAVDPDAETQAVGTVSMALTATSTSGAVYQLRNATLRITGTENATILSEEHLGQDRVEHDLAAGNYLLRLGDGWTLEKIVDGVPVAVVAELLSDNPMAFTVTDQEVLPLTFIFRSGEDMIELGSGRIEVGILVEDGPVEGSGPENDEATCSDGIDNDGNGLADCADASCEDFCEVDPEPGTLLWTFSEPGLAPFQEGMANGSQVIGIAGNRIRVLEDGNLISAAAPAALSSFARGALVSSGVLAFVSVNSSTTQVNFLDPEDPLTQVAGGQVTFSPGSFVNEVIPGANSDEVVVATSSTAASQSTLTNLSTDGSMLWQTPLPQFASNMRGVSISNGVYYLAEDAASIRVYRIQANGTLALAQSVGKPADGRALAIAGADAGIVHFYVTHPSTGVLARYHIDPQGPGGGLTFGPYASPATHVAVDGEDVGIVHANQTLEVATVDAATRFTVPLSFTSVADVFFSEDAVCVAGAGSGAAQISCFQR